MAKFLRRPRPSAQSIAPAVAPPAPAEAGDLGELLRALMRFETVIERVRRPIARQSAEHRHELSRAIADLRFALAETDRALWARPTPASEADTSQPEAAIPHRRSPDAEISRLQLPRSLDTIARVIGLRAALLIGSEMVGRRVSIPKPDRLRTDNELGRLIGQEALAQLAAHYVQGATLDIPPALPNRRGRRRRWQVIAQMTAEGRSLSDIANTLECDRSTVRRARIQRPPQPLPLFGE